MQKTDEGKLSDNITLFARLLRNSGLPVGPAHTIDAINAITTLGISNREDFYTALNAIFVHKKEEQPVFDMAFSLFWRSRNLVEKILEVLSPRTLPTKEEKPEAAAARVTKALMNRQMPQSQELNPEVEVNAKYSVSGKEVLQSKDFAQMNVEEIAAAKKAIAELKIDVPLQKSRRFKASPRGARFDVRKSVRKSLSTGGEMVSPIFKNNRTTERPIVALCDISGSMAQYSRLFMHFLHALSDQKKCVHSFVFGTQLSNISRALKRKDPDEALEACSQQVGDWSGGTRIASALHRFNKDWSRRVLGQGAIVLLITDGLERDGDDDLAFEAERLQKSCHQLIWLNPLLRFDGFEPKAGGVRALLPFVDQFKAIHSLNAIDELCRVLSTKHQNGFGTQYLRKMKAVA